MPKVLEAPQVDVSEDTQIYSIRLPAETRDKLREIPHIAIKLRDVINQIVKLSEEHPELFEGHNRLYVDVLGDCRVIG